MQGRSLAIWTFAVTSVALVMVMLDNLVVSTALNVIREELGATIEQLEWTVNAYTLTFAVFLLTGAALGDRFGRRRMFVIGVAIFTAASAFSAMSTSVEMLLIGRMAQGIGAAIVTPLTLTLLSAAVAAERRGVALGAWGAVGGLAIAIGPLVGGAIVEGVSWNWIFWINVPIGIALVPFGWFALRESHGPASRLDLPGVALASVGLLGVVWALINGNSEGWTSPTIVAAFAIGVAFLAGFLAWERRAPAPMLPPRFFRDRSFSLANVSSMLMSFGMFGSIFLLAQFLQFVRFYSPLEAGAAILPWTLAPMFVAPVAGALSDRIGGGLLMGTGLSLQAIGLAWLGLVSSTTVEYSALVLPFLISGIGMGLFFAPVANVLLSSVRPEEEGQASGAGNAIRELGGVFGVAVLAAVFARNGGFGSPQAFVDGMVPAILMGAAFVGLGAVAAFAIPRTRRVPAEQPELRVASPHGGPAVGDPAPVYIRIDELAAGRSTDDRRWVSLWASAAFLSLVEVRCDRLGTKRDGSSPVNAGSTGVSREVRAWPHITGGTAMTHTIVCFGDSNTHGAHPDPSIGGRHPRDVRWPGVMRAALGEGYEIIEEGLNGRCTVWDTPIEPGRCGLTYLAPCLLSHRPVDLVTIMLGTNDVKRIYGMTASEIACGAGALVDVAKGTLCGPDELPPRVLLVAPVPVGEATAHSEMWGFGASREESRRLAGMYRLVADGRGVGFFDAGSVASVSPLDGVHLDAVGHAALGAAMAKAVLAELARV